MKLSFEVGGSLEELMAREIAAAEVAVTRGIDGAGRELQAALRGQITTAGLGKRLANSIRRRTYPQGQTSADAAAMVWANAPEIIDAFDRGAVIRSKDGFWLAIPLPAAGRFPGRRMSPGLWEQRTGVRLRFVYRPRRPSLLVADDARLTKAGRATRKRGKRRRDGLLSGAQTVPIFILVPQVRLRRRLDVARAAAEAQAGLPGRILAAWPD